MDNKKYIKLSTRDLVLFQDYLGPLGNSYSSSFQSSVINLSSNTNKEELHYPSENPEITVVYSKCVSGCFSRYILYEIKGTDSLGQYSILRRYKEFYNLYKLLCNQWPGCNFTCIPPKKKIVIYIKGNFKARFIEKRRKLLEYFMRNIARIYYIYSCEDFQDFIRGNNDFTRYDTYKKPIVYKDIQEKYTTHFISLLSFKRTDADKERLDTIESQLSERIFFIENLYKKSLKYEKKCERLDTGFIDLFHNFEESIGVAKDKTEIISKTEIKQQSPFSSLVFWCESSILSTLGFINSIRTIKSLENYKLRIEKSLETSTEDDLYEGEKSEPKDMITYLDKIISVTSGQIITREHSLFIINQDKSFKEILELIYNKAESYSKTITK